MSGSTYGDQLFETECRAIDNILLKFATHIPKSVSLDLRSSEEFGGFAKAYIGLQGVLSETLSEGVYFSLYHPLECETDLKASIMLAQECFYKHAFAALRNCLENAIKPLYWTRNRQEFLDWKNAVKGDFPFTGKSGNIRKLSQMGMIEARFAQELEGSYTSLSGFIHSGEKKMVHAGLATNRWKGHTFSSDRLDEYLRSAKQVIEQVIKLHHFQVGCWLSAVPPRDTFCSVCHSQSGFVITNDIFGEKAFQNFTCPGCGHKWKMSA